MIILNLDYNLVLQQKTLITKFLNKHLLKVVNENCCGISGTVLQPNNSFLKAVFGILNVFVCSCRKAKRNGHCSIVGIQHTGWSMFVKYMDELVYYEGYPYSNIA